MSPLREPYLIGTEDPRDLTTPRPRQRATERPPPSGAIARPPGLLAPRDDSATALIGENVDVAASPAPPEPATPTELVSARAFVQILSPPAVATRIARATHRLARDHPKLSHQKTIVGALIERDIPDPDDPVVLAAMAAVLARWRQDPMDDERCSRRLGWHLPLPLSDRLKTLLCNLRETHHPLRPSATALLTAIIWYEVDPDSAAGYRALVNLVAPYYRQWERPRYELIAP